MMNLLNYILWDPNLVAFKLGPFSIRWYGLMWVIGLVVAYLLVQRLYKEQKIKDEYFDPLAFYCFFGILIGARLGHCLFYEPDYFLTSSKGIIEMILPIRFGDDGSWLGQTFGFHVIGYAGLASHGGTLGLMIALWMYVRRTKLSIWTVLDNIAIATGSTACCIRLGNLMNSEIIGKITDVPWAFIFEKVEDSCTRPSPTPSCLSSCGLCIKRSLRRLVLAGISDSALRISSPSASSSNTPRRYRRPSRHRFPSIWDRYSLFPLSYWEPTA